VKALLLYKKKKLFFFSKHAAGAAAAGAAERVIDSSILHSLSRLHIISHLLLSFL
jgi:hypothetical protein